MPSYEEYCEEIRKLWDSHWLTNMGTKHKQLQASLEEFLACPHVILYTNGHLALENVIAAMNLPKGGEVITTPFTFASTTHAIVRNDLVPVFCDINPEDFTIDVGKIEGLITEKTVAIVPVHVYGNICDVEEIDRIAKKHNLKVIYDACHSVGVMYNGKSVFNYGDVSCTSYHATKMLNSGEGGGCFTNDAELDAKMKRIRFFGFSEDKTNIVEEGSNLKMTEVHASVGLANLKYLQLALDDRKEKYMLYKQLLSANPTLKFQKMNGDSCNYSYFPVIFDSEETLLKVDKALQAEHVFARRYFYPSLNTFKDIVPYVPMPVSENIASRILCLPLYYTLSKENVERIANIVLKAL